MSYRIEWPDPEHPEDPPLTVTLDHYSEVAGAVRVLLKIDTEHIEIWRDDD